MVIPFGRFTPWNEMANPKLFLRVPTYQHRNNNDIQYKILDMLAITSLLPTTSNMCKFVKKIDESGLLYFGHVHPTSHSFMLSPTVTAPLQHNPDVESAPFFLLAIELSI